MIDDEDEMQSNNNSEHISNQAFDINGVNNKRYSEMLDQERDPMVGVFNKKQAGQGKALDMKRLDFLKLNYQQNIDRMTKEMLDQAKQSEFGKEVLKGSDLKDHQYIADIAVAKISKNLALLQELEQPGKVDSKLTSTSNKSSQRGPQ